MPRSHPPFPSRRSRAFLSALALIGPIAWCAAQRPGGGRPVNGRLYGKIIDAGTNKPAEFATVALFSTRHDSLIAGSITRANGDFELTPVPAGNFRLKVSFIGYKPLEQNVTLTREQPEMDLGNLVLEPDVETLKTAEVTGERSQVVMKVDRRVYNVEKDLSTQGGSGVDVMKNVPGLSVDVEGNVQMRGASPQILVDGRPTSMTLEQIPAEEIERVEVITNPSVAFDANTTGGIINVVLKKSTKPGYSGMLQGGAGTNDRYQTSGNLNVKEGRWAFNGSLNFNNSNNLTKGETNRTDLTDGQPAGYFDQSSENNSNRRMFGGRIGAEWQVDNRNTLTASQSFRDFDRGGSDSQDYHTTGPGGEPLSTGTQLNNDDSNMESYTSQIGFRRKSPKPDKEWTADLTYNTWARSSTSTYHTIGTMSDGTPAEDSPRLQENIGGSRYDQLSLQMDFIDPLGERNKLEWGLKGNWKLDNTFLDVYVTNPDTSFLDPTLSNDYSTTDLVNAAYANWTHRMNERWSFQAGLRFEQTWFVTDIKDKDLEYSYKYPDGTKDLGRSIFPAVYVVRRWEESLRELQFNFSRKISRPNGWQMMPFIYVSDSRNVRIGNPVLAPEVSNLGEVNHLLPFGSGKNNWLTSFFGRYTEDVITQYVYPLASDTSILVTTWVNGHASWTTGWENTLRLEPVKGLQTTLSGTIQYSDVTLGRSQGATRNQGTNWEAKLLVSYKLPKSWSVQANGEYESGRVIPQGRTLPQYGVDLSLSKDITKRLQAVCSLNDVFNTRRWGNELETATYTQENYRRRDQRNLRVTLTWRFGEQNTSLFRRKQQRREPGQEGGDMEGF